MLPKLLHPYHLSGLETAESGEIAGARNHNHNAFKHEMEPTHSGNEENVVVELSDAEILEAGNQQRRV